MRQVVELPLGFRVEDPEPLESLEAGRLGRGERCPENARDRRLGGSDFLLDGHECVSKIPRRRESVVRVLAHRALDERD